MSDLMFTLIFFASFVLGLISGVAAVLYGVIDFKDKEKRK